ncbi:MAG: hypothetical protein PWQ70_2065 [Clostridiales bacterium]|nr:hypothetical protein [Clostridiales bacterium]
MKNNQNRIALFCIVTSLYWFALYAYVPTLSTYSKSLGASYKMVGLIIGSYGFIQMLLRIPLGIVSDTLNKRKIFVITGAVLAFASSLGLWYFPHVGLVLVFRALAGAAATAWVTYTVLFSSYFEDEKAPKAIGILNSFNFSGQMAAILLGSIAAQYFGPQAPFLVASIGGGAALILSFGVTENQVIHRKPLKISEVLTVALDGQLLLFSTLAILSQFVTFATVYGFTPVIAQQMGASDFELGLLTTFATIPVIFSSFMSGTIFTRWIGERKTIVSGFLISAFSCIVIPYIQHIYLLYIVQFIAGFGRGLAFSLLMGLSIKHVHSAKRATAMGFFQAIYGLGMFLGPVVVGIFSDTIGLIWGFWTTGLISILGGFIAYHGTSKNQ